MNVDDEARHPDASRPGRAASPHLAATHTCGVSADAELGNGKPLGPRDRDVLMCSSGWSGTKGDVGTSLMVGT